MLDTKPYGILLWPKNDHYPSYQELADLETNWEANRRTLVIKEYEQKDVILNMIKSKMSVEN